jgi:general secretion pathway protein L
MGRHIAYCDGRKGFTTENGMANALEQKLLQLKTGVQTGPVGQFFSWWIEELRQALPPAWQEKLHHASRRVTLQAGANLLRLAVDENHQVSPLGELPVNADRDVMRQQTNDLLRQHDLEESPRFLLLEIDRCLVKEVVLPAAAESNLRQVLTFEMDRQTPFRAADVYFDWSVLERGGAGGQLRLQLYVVPRTEVEQAIKTLTDRGMQLSGVDVRDGDRTLGLNLMPPEQRHKVVNSKVRDNLVLAGAAALLLVLAMALSLYLREHQVAELEEAIASVRGEANQVARIRNQIEGASEAAGFLASRRAESPLAVELLAEVTRILPDDTYLDRLVISNTSVQIQGKSQNAQQLIEKVNQSELLEAAAFRGSTRLDARSGLEIFEINAQISPVAAQGGSHGATP